MKPIIINIEWNLSVVSLSFNIAVRHILMSVYCAMPDLTSLSNFTKFLRIDRHMDGDDEAAKRMSHMYTNPENLVKIVLVHCEIIGVIKL